MLDIAKEESLITEATLRGEVYGTYGFHHKISQLISRSTKSATHGGDRKSEAYKHQAG
jgi:putative transposase